MEDIIVEARKLVDTKVDAMVLEAYAKKILEVEMAENHYHQKVKELEGLDENKLRRDLLRYVTFE